MTLVGPDRSTIKSATGVTDVLTLEPAAEPLLLFIFGSGVSDVPEATLTNEPLAGAVMVKVKFTDAPFVKVTPAQTTTLLLKV